MKVRIKKKMLFKSFELPLASFIVLLRPAKILVKQSRQNRCFKRYRVLCPGFRGAFAANRKERHYLLKKFEGAPISCTVNGGKSEEETSKAVMKAEFSI